MMDRPTADCRTSDNNDVETAVETGGGATKDRRKKPMTELHKQVLLNNRQQLVQDLGSVFMVIAVLYQEKVLTRDEKECLETTLGKENNESKRKETVEKLLDILPRKGDFAYEEFKKCVEQTSEQEHLFDTMCRYEGGCGMMNTFIELTAPLDIPTAASIENLLRRKAAQTVEEVITSENRTNENITSENITSENITSEDITSENITNEDITNEEKDHHQITLPSDDNESADREMLDQLKELSYSATKRDVQELVDQLTEIPYFATKRDVHEQGGLCLMPKPVHYVGRDRDVKKILDLLKQDQTVGINGLGGIGKTVLAQAVSEKMTKDLRVVWLTLGVQPVVLKLFHQLHKDLNNGTPGNFKDIDSASDWFKKFSETEKCMLVLDDVWSLGDVSPFKNMSKNCKVLITTRNDRILLLLNAHRYNLNTLDRSQSRALFLKCADTTDDSLGVEERKVVNNIISCLGDMPLAVTAAGYSVRDNVHLSYLRSTLEQFTQAQTSFWESEEQNITCDYRPGNCTVFGAFEASFQALNPREPNKLNSVQKLFLKFAIFKEDIDVPSYVLLALWKHEISSEDCHFEKCLKELKEKSLITVSKQESHGRFYRMHDLVLDYARYKLRNIDSL